MELAREDIIKFYMNKFQERWLPKGIGPLSQVSGNELMFSLDDAPWTQTVTAAGLLPVRLRSMQIIPESAMSWQIKDRETNRIVVCRLDGDDLKMIIRKPELLGDAFDACLAIQSGIQAQRVG